MSRGARAGSLLAEIPVRVGRSDDPVLPPRDDEQHAPFRARDDPGGRPQPLTRHDQVHSLGGAHPQAVRLRPRSWQVAGPHSGRVDHLPGAHVDGPARLDVDQTCASHRVAGPQKLGHLAPAGRECAVGDRRSHERRGEPSVVDLGVPVLHRAGQAVRAKGGRLGQCRTPGQVPMARQALPLARGGGQSVVDQDASAHIRSLPHPVRERVEERHRLDEVRRDPVEQQASLLQRLADQPEVEHLQVPQPAVDELARAARRAAGPVLSLDDRRPQAPSRRIHRGAGPDDTSSDNQHVQLGRSEAGQRVSSRSG